MKTGRFWTHNGVVMISIDPFTVGKHGDVFLWAELRWRQKDPSGHFTNVS